MKFGLMILLAFAITIYPESIYAESPLYAATSNSNNDSQVVSTSSWEYPIVHFRNSTYRIMMEPPVHQKKVGPKLGKVERNISSFDAVDEDNKMIDTTYKNGDSNVLKVDTPIYKFRNRSTKECIIVSYKNKYYKAVRRMDTSSSAVKSLTVPGSA